MLDYLIGEKCWCWVGDMSREELAEIVDILPPQDGEDRVLVQFCDTHITQVKMLHSLRLKNKIHKPKAVRQTVVLSPRHKLDRDELEVLATNIQDVVDDLRSSKKRFTRGIHLLEHSVKAFVMEAGPDGVIRLTLADVQEALELARDHDT